MVEESQGGEKFGNQPAVKFEALTQHSAIFLQSEYGYYFL
jgi:hypothetical protein